MAKKSDVVKELALEDGFELGFQKHLPELAVEAVAENAPPEHTVTVVNRDTFKDGKFDVISLAFSDGTSKVTLYERKGGKLVSSVVGYSNMLSFRAAKALARSTAGEWETTDSQLEIPF